MIGQAGRRTATPSVTPLQPKKWNACFCIMVNFWWSAGLVDRLEPHLPSLSKQKNDMLIFVLHSSSDHWPGWSMDSNPICHLSPGIKWNAHFCITFNLWWSAGLVDELESHLPPLSSHKNEVLIFALRSTSDDQQGWSMDSNPICHPSPAKKIKCLFLDYVQLLMISQAGQWTQTPSATPLQPKKWYACFWIMLNFWWLARLVDGLEPHLLPLSSQKNEMLVFGLCSTSDDQPGWSMDSNPIHHPSPAKKMKCSFLYYIQLLMIGWAGQWTQTPSATPLQPKKWSAHFWITFNFWWLAGLANRLKPHLPPLSRHKMKCSFLHYIQLVMISRAGWWTWIPSATPLQPQKWSAHFWIMFNFWWLAGLVNGLESHPPPVSSQRMKCSFLDYIQLLMIGRAGRWTRIPSATSFQPKKWNAHFCIMFNFWWSAELVDGLDPHLPPLSNQKNEMLAFVLRYSSDHQLRWSMDSKPIHHPSSQKMKC